MDMLRFESHPLWVNLLLFAVAGVVVWGAGTRIARYADRIAERTGIGHATIGLVLLALVTSLPEVATSATAALRNQAALGVNNLLGGLAFQVMVVAIADAALRRDALTSVNPSSAILMQAVLNIVLLTIVIAGIVIGDVAVLGVGLWTTALVPVYAVSLFLLRRFGRQPAWVVDQRAHDERKRQQQQRDRPEAARDAEAERSLGRLLTLTGIAAALILLAGYVATRASESLAEQTGLGTSFFGAVALAGATSLPEISTAIESVRLRRYSMALSDIFGTNLIDVVLIFLVDLIYSGGPVLNEVGRFAVAAGLLGTMLTTFYIVGLLERRDRVVLRMGVDSLLVVITYVAGLVLLFRLR